MRKILLLCMIMSGLAIASSSQNIDKNDINFEYIRLPQKPLDKSIKNYICKVSMTYEAKIAERKAAYQKQLHEAESKYADEMKTYDTRVKVAQEKYNKDLAEYNKKGTLGKVFDKSVGINEKPVLVLPSAPYKDLPKEERYPRTFSSEMTSSYIKLEGFQSGVDNPLEVLVTLMGFENTVPEVKQNSTTYMEKGVSYQKYTFWYEFQYKHPMGMKVSTKAGSISDEMMFAENIKANTQSFTSEYELKNWWEKNQDAFISNLEDKIVTENLKKMNTTLNERHGFVKTARSTELCLVKDKKGLYTDYGQAYEAAMEAYLKLSEEPLKKSAKEKLKTAIDLWEAAMKESSPENKKARVDMDVTIITALNLVEGYVWMDDYTSAEKYIVKLAMLDLSKKERKRTELLKQFLKDQKERFAANNP